MPTANTIAALQRESRRQAVELAGITKRSVDAALKKTRRYPKGVEISYAGFLVGAQRKINEVIRRQLEGAKSILDQARRADAAVERADDLTDDIIRAFISLGQTVNRLTSATDGVLGLGITAHGVKTVQFNDRKYASPVMRLIGINDASAGVERSILKGWTVENTELIKNMNVEQLGKLQSLFMRSLRDGSRSAQIEGEVEKILEGSAKRARLIARDQIGKLNGQLDRYKQTQAGLDSYVWRGVLDERERPEHVEREGKIYQWDDPPIDGHPGQPVQCRCSPEPNLEPLLGPEFKPDPTPSDMSRATPEARAENRRKVAAKRRRAAKRAPKKIKKPPIVPDAPPVPKPKSPPVEPPKPVESGQATDLPKAPTRDEVKEAAYQINRKWNKNAAIDWADKDTQKLPEAATEFGEVRDPLRDYLQKYYNITPNNRVKYHPLFTEGVPQTPEGYVDPKFLERERKKMFTDSIDGGNRWQGVADPVGPTGLAPEVIENMGDSLDAIRYNPKGVRNEGLNVLIHEELHHASKVDNFGDVLFSDGNFSYRFLEESTTEIATRRIWRDMIGATIDEAKELAIAPTPGKIAGDWYTTGAYWPQINELLNTVSKHLPDIPENRLIENVEVAALRLKSGARYANNAKEYIDNFVEGLLDFEDFAEETVEALKRDISELKLAPSL